MASVAETAALSIDRHANGMLLSPWEFDRANFEEGWRYELVNGVLIVNPAPLRNERDPNEELGRLLRNYHEQHPQGSSLDATVPEETVTIGPHRRRVDRAIWAGLGRLPFRNEPPTIAVEFVSEGKSSRDRDHELKRDEYRAIEVKEYWIVDRFARQMTVYRYQRGKMTCKVVSGRQSYTSPLLPGFRLSIAKLLKYADRWGGK